MYRQRGLTSCLIVRRQPSGKFAIASLLVDRLCLGVKSCFIHCNFTENDLEEFKGKMSNHGDLEEVTPEYFHNLIYASIDYAQGLGFEPPKDFSQAELLLDETLISDGIDAIEVGWDGKPTYISGPYDNVSKIMAVLERTVGTGNYEFTHEF